MVGIKDDFDYINSGYITCPDGTLKFYDPSKDHETPSLIKFLKRNKMLDDESMDVIMNYIQKNRDKNSKEWL
jgi:hypothetical protein